MYKFIDTNETQETGSSLPAEALSINGQYIENLISGYRTLHVSGRELLGSEISDLEIGNSDGSRYQSKKYLPRTITVTYQLLTASDAAFRAAFNKLNQVLDVEEAQLVFADEPDMYFIGTKAEVGEVTPGSNKVIGEIEFYCTDPFKYSMEEKELTPVLDDNLTFVVDYDGTYPCYPRLSAEANGDLGFVAFINENAKIIQIGDPEEADKETADFSEALVDYQMQDYDSADWTLNKAVPVDALNSWTHTGTLAVKQDGSRYVLAPTSYGGASGWHGPSITMQVPADSSGHAGAKNFTFEWICSVVAADYIRMGDAEFLVTAKDSGGRRYNLAGVAFFKTEYGTLNGAIGMYINGKEIGLISAPFIEGNALVDYKMHSIQKFGSTITFNIAGQKYEYTRPEFEDVEAVEISVILAQLRGNLGFYKNNVEWLRFTSHSVAGWKDVPNKLANGDVVEADCQSGEIYFNGVPAPELGALGNDWEDFRLNPGRNQITCAYSSWGEQPDFKLKYREVYI